MIVIDIGSATYGGDESIFYLVETFQPTILYGFDPNGEQKRWMVGNTHVITERSAAWIFDGEVPFTKAGTSGKVGSGPMTPCFDLGAFILGLPAEEEIVLKADAEGAEFVLLPDLMERGIDARLKLAWIERHCLECGRGGGGHREGCFSTISLDRYEEIAKSMKCEMHSWNR